jgi:hypothetical protein
MFSSNKNVGGVASNSTTTLFRLILSGSVEGNLAESLGVLHSQRYSMVSGASMESYVSNRPTMLSFFSEMNFLSNFLK